MDDEFADGAQRATTPPAQPPMADDKIEPLRQVCADAALALDASGVGLSVMTTDGTHGMAVANVYASYQFGLRVFDSSVAGLGGCPYAEGATGNVATEDLVYLLHGIGASTGIDLDALIACGRWICGVLDRPNGSRQGRLAPGKGAGDRCEVNP